MTEHSKINCGSQPTGYRQPLNFQYIHHFLPPGVAYTTGLSHNGFTWRPLKGGKKTLTPKSSAM